MLPADGKASAGLLEERAPRQAVATVRLGKIRVS